MNREPSMSEYVWDRSGPVDADVARLEAALSGFKHVGKEPELVIGPRAELTYVEAVAPEAKFERSSRGRGLAAAAMVGLAVIAGWIARPALGPWLKVEATSGVPMVGLKQSDGRMHVGQWLQTDGGSSAEIEVASIGSVKVMPNSKIRVRKTGENEHRLEMQYGEIHAFITAPPRVFFVDTPSATAVDMGCEYTLDVDEEGSGVLRVSLGHVILEGPRGLTSDVPMWGGMCRVKRGVGPGTPYFEDASTVLIEALARFDFGGGSEEALRVVLDEARERDSLSLWHLIPRTAGASREAVVDRLAALKPMPEVVRRSAVLKLDSRALKAWNEAMRPY